MDKPDWALAALRHEWALLVMMVMATLAVGWSALHAQHLIVYAIPACFALCLLWLTARWRLNRILAGDEPARRLGAPLLGAAPLVTRRDLRKLPPDRRSGSDFVLAHPQSDYAAAFRNLAEAASGPISPIIAMTAPRASDGGAEETLALARTLAAAGKRVVAIDCDMRLRRLSTMMGAAPPHGLAEVLTGKTPWRQAIVEDDRSFLHLILATYHDENDHRRFFDAPGFAELLRALQENYDCVILSPPSVLGLAVTPIIVQRSTLCVLIVRWAHSPTASVRAALRVMRRFKDIQLGILLTGVANPDRLRWHVTRPAFTPDINTSPTPRIDRAFGISG